MQTPLVDSGVGIDLPDGTTIMIHNDPDLRAFVIQAVNAHDALVEAAEQVADMFSASLPGYYPWLDKTRAALKLAKGS